MFEWEPIISFGSLRERDRFLSWMQLQIASGVGEEIKAPPCYTDERWFRHVPTGAFWRLVPDDNPYGPGFWAARQEIAA